MSDVSEKILYQQKDRSNSESNEEDTNVNYQPDEEHGLTIFGGVLSIISTILGGGIVALPYAFYMLGFWAALGLMIAMAVSTINSSILYLKAKDLTPGKPESLYELGYILLKRPSIFIISSILAINSLGLCMVYFIIFGETMGGIVANLRGEKGVINTTISGETFIYQRTMYIIILSTLLFPVVIQKELQELHIVSMGLFGAILSFIFILFLQLLIFKTDTFDYQQDKTTGAYDISQYIDFETFQSPGELATFWTIVKSVSCSMVAYSFANNLFPIYSSMKEKTNENMKTTIMYGIGLTFFIYSFLSVVCVFMFGSGVAYSTNLMDCVNKEYAIDSGRFESFILQFLFMIVLACHIPFIFFSGKESLCIIVDEIDRKSISTTLDERIEFLQKIDRSKNVLAHEISHKEVAQDLDQDPKSRGNSKNVEPAGGAGGEYDYSALDNDMKQQLTQNTDQRQDTAENRNQSAISTDKKSMKGRQSDGGRATNSSHQTNLRYTLQKTQQIDRKSRLSSNGRQSEVKTGRASRITFVRETQSLRKTVQLTTYTMPKETERLSQSKDIQEDDQSVQGAKEEEGLAYKGMKNSYYYGITIFYYYLIVFGAIIIPSVDVIFEFVGAICGCSLGFIFPAFFYMYANSKYPENRDVKDKGKLNVLQGTPPSDVVLLGSAYFQMGLGIVAFFLMMFNNIHGLIED